METDRRPFGPRWWLLASIAFAGFSLVLSPLAMVLLFGMMIAIGFGGSPLPGQILLGIVVFVILPGLLAVASASWIESAFNSNRPDRAKRWGWRTVVSVLGFLSPLIVLPTLFSLVLKDAGGTDEELEAARHHTQRPIVESDSMGFCSPPSWVIRDGFPELTLAVRVPEAGSYALTFQGSYGRRSIPSKGGPSWSSKGLMGMTIEDLEAGVDTMTVKIHDSARTPIEWPVFISHISLSHSDGTGSIDVRGGDSLYILDSTGVRGAVNMP